MSTNNMNEEFHKKSASTHTNSIGLAHFLIDEALLKMVEEYGAYVELLPKSQTYKMSFFDGNGDQDFTGNLSELKDRLRNLHQPINTGIGKSVKSTSGYNDASAGKKIMMREKVSAQISTEREDTLSLFRVITTNSATLPEYIDPNEDVEHQHGPEHDIRTADMWRDTCEIDINNRVNNYEQNTQEENAPEPAIIRGSHFNTSKGFEFDLSTEFIANKNTKDVNKIVYDMICTVKDAEAIFGNKVNLTMDEMDQFCALAHDNLQKPEFINLLKDTRHQERVEEIIERIESEVQDINSPIYKAVIKNAAIDNNKRNTLNDLLYANSAITPLLESAAMKARQSHYYFMQRKEPTLNNVVDNVNVLNDVTSHYSAAEHTTQAHIEAIALDPELQKILSFQRNIAHAIEDALPNVTGISEEEKDQHAQSYRAVQKIIGNMSISGQNMSTGHIDDDLKDVIDVFERTMDTGHDGFSRMSSEFVDNTLDFFQDIYKRPFASKKEFASSLIVLSWLTYYMQSGGDVEGANQILETANTLTEAATSGTVPDTITPPTMSFDDIMGSINEGGALSDTAAQIEDLDLSKLTEEDKKEFVRLIRDNGLDISDEQMQHLSSYVHNNYGILGAYKHFTIDNAVTGTTLSLLDLARLATENTVEALGGNINEAASFFKSASNGAIDAGDKTFKVNVFQTTIGHVPMIAALAVMALTSGPRNGIKRIFGFFDGFANSTIATLKDRPLAIPAATLTALLEPQTIILANEADKGGFAFPLLAGIAAASIWKHKANSTKDLHKEIIKNARTLTDHLNSNEEHFKLLDSRPDIAESLSQAALLQEKIRSDLPDNVKEISYSKKRLFGGLTNNFNISSANLEPTITALHKFDLAMDISSRYMGEENKTYHNFIHNKITSFTQALKDVQNEKMTVKEFERHINKDLKKVMQAQAFISGSSDIYDAAYKESPSERMIDRLSFAGQTQYNAQSRKDSFKQYSQNVSDLQEKRSQIGGGVDFAHLPLHQRNGLTQATYTLTNAVEKLDINMKIAWERTKQACNPVWDKICLGARAAQGSLKEIPHKKHAGLALIGTGLALAGLDTAGIGGEAVQNIVPHAGYSLGVLGSTGMFLLINPIDDLVFAHLGLGGLGYGAGTLAYGANKLAVKPAYNYACEKIESFLNKHQEASESLNSNTKEIEKVEIPINYIDSMSEACLLCKMCMEENIENPTCPKQVNLMMLLSQEDKENDSIITSEQNQS